MKRSVFCFSCTQKFESAAEEEAAKIRETEEEAARKKEEKEAEKKRKEEEDAARSRAAVRPGILPNALQTLSPKLCILPKPHQPLTLHATYTLHELLDL